MSIMDFFRSNEQQQASANQQQVNQQQASNQQPNHTGSSPQQPPNGQMPGTNQGEIDPLAAYAKMFERAEPKPEDAAPSFSLDPNVLSEVSSKMNFTQDIPQELMQQALNGDGQSLMKIINHAAQSAYKASLSHTSTLTDKFVAARTDHAMKNLAPVVKKELTSNALASTPNFQHPVVKQQLQMVAESIAAQHPDLPPQEVAQMAGKYITDLANAINPSSNKPTESEPTTTDWSKFFS